MIAAVFVVRRRCGREAKEEVATATITPNVPTTVATIEMIADAVVAEASVVGSTTSSTVHTVVPALVQATFPEYKPPGMVQA